MKELSSYRVLTEDVFYRGMHILDYLYTEEDISGLDIEAIKNTILTALVEKNEIDPNKEFLDLKRMIITDVFYFGCDIYNPKPFVQGFPLWMKEKLRSHSLKITGSLPVSVHAARPTSELGYCVYDANTAFSILFDDFAFLVADYNSPTRAKTRATDRPFLEATVNGTPYLFDILTKRMYDKKEFARIYDMEIKDYVRKSDFNVQQKQLYAEQTQEDDRNYGSFLALTYSLIDAMKDVPGMQEYIHEIELSRKFFPKAFDDAEQFKQEVEQINYSTIKV